MPENAGTKTILIFTDWYVPGFRAGGPIQSVFNMARLLKKHYIVKVVCRNKDLNSDSAYSGISCNTWLELSENHFVMYLDKNGEKLIHIKRLIKDNINNIIYINGLYSFKYSVIPTLLVSYFNVRKCFISVRGMLHKSALSIKPVKKQLFLAFARGYGLFKKIEILATDENEAEEIRRSLGNVTISIAPNIPMLPEDASDQPRVKKKDDHRTSFLFLGRIAPEKNPLALIQALQLADLPCHVIFCGSSLDSSYFASFKKHLASLPVKITWQYIEDFPHHEITTVFNMTDVMVLPSLGENFGHAIFESFVHSVPVIIGNNTPWKNIESEKAGIETEPSDIKGIADALKWFINMDNETYALWSKGARIKALEYFDSTNFEELYVKLFS